MERANFFGDQLVLSDDLNTAVGLLATQSIYRTLAPLGGGAGIGNLVTGSVGGIYGSPADYLDADKNFYITVASSSQLIMAPGTAVAPSGELIRSLLHKTMNLGGSDSNYSWPNEPLTIQYIKLRYTEAGGSNKSNDLGIPFPTRYTSSYFVLIDSAIPVGNDIRVGRLVTDGTGLITTHLEERYYVRTITPANAVILDPFPLNKPVAAWTSVQDHVQAVGTGQPTQINAHGLALADLQGGADLFEHRKWQHVPGIYFTNMAYGATADLAYTASVVTGGPSDAISFGAPQNSVIVAGNGLVTGSIANLTTSTALADGVFDVYVGSTGIAAFVTSSLGKTFLNLETSPHGSANFAWMCRAYLSNGATTVYRLDDLRDFFTFSPYDIRPDTQELASLDSLTSSTTHSLVSNLRRIRYALGKAANGNGTAGWTGPYPLTAGPASVADAYHTHNFSVPFTATSGSFQNFMGSTLTRALDTTYQNASSSVRHISLSMQVNYNTGADQVYFELQISPTPGIVPTVSRTGYTEAMVGAGIVNGMVQNFTISSIIPAGSYYHVITIQAGSPTIALLCWTERN